MNKNGWAYKQATQFSSTHEKDTLREFDDKKEAIYKEDDIRYFSAAEKTFNLKDSSTPETRIRVWSAGKSDTLVSLCTTIVQGNATLAANSKIILMRYKTPVTLMENELSFNSGGCRDCDGAWKPYCPDIAEVTDYDKDGNIEILTKHPNEGFKTLYEIENGKMIIKAKAEYNY